MGVYSALEGEEEGYMAAIIISSRKPVKTNLSIELNITLNAD